MSASPFRILRFARYDIENKCIISPQKESCVYVCSGEARYTLHGCNLILNII